MTFRAPLPPRIVATIVDTSRLPDVRVEGARGFTLAGPTGTGKTTAACHIARQCADVPEDPSAVGYLTALQYQRLHEQTRQREKLLDRAVEEADRDEAWQRYNAIIGFDEWLHNDLRILVLDDWGTEHTTQTGYIETRMEYLLRSRFDRSLATVITTNLTAAGIVGRFGERTADFLKEAAPVVPMPGRSSR